MRPNTHDEGLPAIKKPASRAGFAQSPKMATPGHLQRNDVRCLQALGSVLDFELNALIFLQRLEARALHFGEVSEEIVAACVRLDKAEALSVVEPFDDTSLSGHGIAFPEKGKKEPDSACHPSTATQGKDTMDNRSTMTVANECAVASSLESRRVYTGE